MTHIELEKVIILLSNQVKAWPGPSFFAVVGSVARENWDADSDLDLFLIRPVSAESIRAEDFEHLFNIEKSDVIAINARREVGRVFYGSLDGVKIDLSVFSEAGLKSLFEEILIYHRPSFTNQRVMCGFRKLRILVSSLEVKYFLSSYNLYPEQLQVNVVKSILANMITPALFYKHARRQDCLTFTSHLGVFFMRLSLLIYALNRCHTGSAKKVAIDFKTFPILPKNYIERMEVFLKKPMECTLADCNQIFGETLDLLCSKIPQLEKDNDILKFRSVTWE